MYFTSRYFTASTARESIVHPPLFLPLRILKSGNSGFFSSAVLVADSKQSPITTSDRSITETYSSPKPPFRWQGGRPNSRENYPRTTEERRRKQSRELVRLKSARTRKFEELEYLSHDHISVEFFNHEIRQPSSATYTSEV